MNKKLDETDEKIRKLKVLRGGEFPATSPLCGARGSARKGRADQNDGRVVSFKNDG